MPWRNAPHIDATNYLLGRPRLGQVWRCSGYGAIALVPPLLAADDLRHLLPWLLLTLLAWWLLAWYLAVGAGWRSSTVAAIVLAAAAQTCVRLGLF